MENPLIQELRAALALSAEYRSDKHPGSEAIVMASQASVRAAFMEIEMLRELLKVRPLPECETEKAIMRRQLERAALHLKLGVVIAEVDGVPGFRSNWDRTAHELADECYATLEVIPEGASTQ